MTMDQVHLALENGLNVEDRYDEDFKTGTIIGIEDERYAIVAWDDDTTKINEIRTLHFS